MSLLKNINKTSKQISRSSENYISATKEYIELKTFQQLSTLFSLLFKIFIIGTLAFLTFTILVIEGIFLLVTLLGSLHYALLLVAGILLLISFLVYLFRKTLIEGRVIKMVAKNFFSTES